MQAIVKNFRGIIDASIQIEPIALLCGNNGAGKTSVARAIAAAATGKPIPFAKITKKDCAVLLRHGTHSGSVTLGDDVNSTTVEWPKADVHSVGAPPYAGEIAAGLVDLLSMKEDDALSYLITLLKADPGMEDLKQEFSAAGIPEKIAESVWKVIDAQGWDAAHKRAVETGQQRKGVWQHITGVGYGSKKALEWLPQDWEDSLFERKIEDIDQLLETQKKSLEQAIGKAAISGVERERMQTLVDGQETRVSQLFTATTKFAQLTKEKDRIAKEIGDTPNPNATTDYACPHCEKPVNITPTSPGHFALTKVEKIDPKKAKELAMKRAALSGEQVNIDAQISENNNLISEIRKQDILAITAAADLKKMGEASAEDSASEQRFLRESILILENQKKMITQYTQAKNANSEIILNQKIVDQLDEKGIRKKKLSNCLDAFMSSYIESLCGDFGIPMISLDADLNVDMGSTSYPLLSASEQFRAKTVLQVAIAMLEKSSLVIIDGADILDRDGRDGLFSMIMGSGLHAVICMTLNSPKTAPDLSTSGVGTTYWVERGKVKQITDERVAA